MGGGVKGKSWQKCWAEKQKLGTTPTPFWARGAEGWWDFLFGQEDGDGKNPPSLPAMADACFAVGFAVHSKTA